MGHGAGPGLFSGTRGRPRATDNSGDKLKPTLPNASHAVIPSEKIEGYSLNERHPTGKEKARIFKSALGITSRDAAYLKKQILAGLPNAKAVLGVKDKYGQRYSVDMPIKGLNGKTVMVRTGWIIRPNSSVPRLTTVFVKPRS